MKILVICGGGVFGLAPAFLLSKTIGKDVISQFDAYGGTSIGSQLVLSYATGVGPDDVFETYSKNIKKIFYKPLLSKLHPFGATYNDKYLNKILANTIKGTLGSIDKPVFVPAYDLSAGSPKVFSTVYDSFDSNYEAWEVARMSSAAPTYFEPYKGFIDGGVVANNPALITVFGLHKALGIPYEEMELFIVGTSTKTSTGYVVNTSKWTKLHWVMPLINSAIYGNEKTAYFGVKNLPLKKCVYFTGVRMDTHWDLDSYDAADEIISRSARYLDFFNKTYDSFIKN